MTLPSQAAVDAAVYNVRVVRDLVARYGGSFEICAQRPDGVVMSAELCAQNATALANWVAILDSAVDALVPAPVAGTAAPAPPPPAPRPQLRLVSKDGEPQ